MERIRLAVVEDNTELRKMLTDFFSAKDDVELIGEATNGVDALELIEKLEPDVMLLDMIMPQMDGFETLKRIRSTAYAKKPEVIALTALCRDDFIVRAIDLGARYYMVKPFDFDLLYQRVQEAGSCSREKSAVVSIPATVNQKTLDEMTANMFLTIGIPAHIKGYQYLRTGVQLVVQAPEMINRITKELYPTIARRFNTSSSKVERAIRHAIEVAWARGRIDVLNQVFGKNVCTLAEKPTNGEFIALVADKLATERKNA